MTALAYSPSSTWFAVPPHQVEAPQLWRQVEAILTEKCEEYRANDVRHAVRRGEMQLWLAAPDHGPVAAVLLTELRRTRDGLVMTVLFVGGSDMRLWIDERARLVEFARQQGATEVRFEGREGWRRIFPEAEKIGVKLRIRT